MEKHRVGSGLRTQGPAFASLMKSHLFNRCCQSETGFRLREARGGGGRAPFIGGWSPLPGFRLRTPPLRAAERSSKQIRIPALTAPGVTGTSDIRTIGISATSWSSLDPAKTKGGGDRSASGQHWQRKATNEFREALDSTFAFDLYHRSPEHTPRGPPRLMTTHQPLELMISSRSATATAAVAMIPQNTRNEMFLLLPPRKDSLRHWVAGLRFIDGGQHQLTEVDAVNRWQLMVNQGRLADGRLLFTSPNAWHCGCGQAASLCFSEATGGSGGTKCKTMHRGPLTNSNWCRVRLHGSGGDPPGRRVDQYNAPRCRPQRREQPPHGG